MPEHALIPIGRERRMNHPSVLGVASSRKEEFVCVRVHACVCLRACVCLCPPGRMWWAACSLCGHCFCLLLFLLFSSSSTPSRLCLSSPGMWTTVAWSTAAECPLHLLLRFSDPDGVSAKWSGSEVSARRRIKTPLSLSPPGSTKKSTGSWPSACNKTLTCCWCDTHTCPTHVRAARKPG